MKKTLETPRLFFREFTQEDAKALFALDSNPYVMRYVGVKPFTDPAQTREMIVRIQQQYTANGIGRWAAILKETGACIGWAGLKFIDEINGVRDTYDLGYRFLPAHWGKGYATEAGMAFIEFGFNEMKLSKITAYVDVANEASVQVLEKCGMQRGNTFRDEGDLCAWYEISNPYHKW